MRCAWVVLVAAFGCVEVNVVECEDGRICPAATACDNAHHTCVAPEQLVPCVGAAGGTECQIDAPGDGICDLEVCIPAGCGDGYRRGDEVCDGEELDPMRDDCNKVGFYDSAPLVCNSACGYSDDHCTGYCGDGEVRLGIELCDGAPPNQACTDLGYGAGFLDCHLCGPDIEACKLFGWNPPRLVPDGMEHLHATSESNVWAVGRGSTVVHFDGFGWNTVSMAGCSSGAEVFSGVWSLGPGQALVSADSTVYRVTPTSCAALPATGAMLLTAIWASSATNVYAVGFSGVHRFDGTSWSQVAVPNVPELGLGAIWGTGADDIWIGKAGALRHWNGTMWESITATDLTMVYAIWGTSPTDVYVGGQKTSDEGVVWHFDGDSWTRLLSISGRVRTGAVANGRVFVGGVRDMPYPRPSESIVLVRDPSGTWIDLAVPISVYDVGGMSVLPSGKLFAVNLGDARVLSYEGTVELTGTDDFGLHSGYEVVARSSSEAYAIVVDSSGIVVTHYLYVWNGTSWALDDTLADPIALDVDNATGTLFALGDAGFSSRASSSSNWVVHDAAMAGAVLWVGAVNDVWIARPSTNELVHWTGNRSTVCPTCTMTIDVRAIWGSSTSDVFAVGDGGAIVHWNGSQWTPMSSGTTVGLNAVWGSGPNDVYAVGLLGTVLHYDGAAWTDISPEISLPINAVWGTGPGDVFIGGGNGIFLHRDPLGRWSPVANTRTTSIGSMDGTGDTLFYVDGGNGARRLVRTAPWYPDTAP